MRIHLQAVGIDVESTKLRRGNFGQVQGKGRLQHAHAHTRKQLGHKPVVPASSKRFNKNTLIQVSTVPNNQKQKTVHLRQRGPPR